MLFLRFRDAVLREILMSGAVSPRNRLSPEKFRVDEAPSCHLHTAETRDGQGELWGFRLHTLSRFAQSGWRSPPFLNSAGLPVTGPGSGLTRKGPELNEILRTMRRFKTLMYVFSTVPP